MTAYERVLASPRSLAAREALAAEWRDKHDPRAELIDKQLRLRKHRLAGTLSSAEANVLYREINVLVRKNGATWAGPVAGLVKEYAFHRGCVAEVTLSGAAFVTQMAALFTYAPIQHVNLVAPLALDEVARSPHLGKLTSLRISELHAAFSDTEAVTLAKSPSIAHLDWLSLADNAIGKAGVEALAASPYLATCIYVNFGGNPTNPTPSVTEYEGTENRARPALAEDLERRFGKRPWLSVPADDVPWPPNRDDIATTA